MNNEEKILSMLETLVTKVDKLEQGQQQTNQRLDKLEQGQAKLETELTDTKSHVIAMEFDQGNQLKALFDSYKQLYDISGEIRSKVGKLEAHQEKHDLQILRLDSDRKSG